MTTLWHYRPAGRDTAFCGAVRLTTTDPAAVTCPRCQPRARLGLEPTPCDVRVGWLSSAIWYASCACGWRGAPGTRERAEQDAAKHRRAGR